MAATVPDSIKAIFGGVPSLIEENITILKREQDNFFCKLCNISISVITDDKTETRNSVTGHISSPAHKQRESEHKTLTDNFEDCVKNMFNRIYPRRDVPPIIFVNLPFLTKIGNKFECTLCHESVNWYYNKYMKNPVKFEIEACCHLLSDKHENNKKELDVQCNIIKDELEKIYGIVPPVIADNIEFIDISHGSYKCKACPEPYTIYSKEQFLDHLQSVKHKKNSEQQMAKKEIPYLSNIFRQQTIPNYVTRNICYLSFYNSGIYCLLCNELIKYECHSPYKTQHNLKNHLFSPQHEEFMLNKRDCRNLVYRRLHEMFESFPVPVLKDLKHLGVKENHFYCHFCDCKIKCEEDDEITRQNILAHYWIDQESIQSSIHAENIYKNDFNYNQIKDYLNVIFHPISDLIKNNIMHLAYNHGERYLYCLICDNKRLQFKADEIEKHLESTGHKFELSEIYNDKKKTELALVEHFFPEDLSCPFKPAVDPIPSYIKQNMENISYEDTSEAVEYKYENVYPYSSSSSDEVSRRDTSNEQEKSRVKGKNLSCNICFLYEDENEPNVIVVGKDDYMLKTNDLLRRHTEYNFRTHFLSEQHKKILQRQAVDRLGIQEKLNEMIGQVPNFVNNNIDYIIYRGPGTKTFSCGLCEELIYLDDSKSCDYHFLGNFNVDSKHQKKEREIEESKNRAMDILDRRFSRIPDIVLRNVEFLSMSERNLTCVLCQETLFLDDHNLEKTASDLSTHMHSKKHRAVLNGNSWRFYHSSYD